MKSSHETESHADIEAHASFVVSLIIPDMAEHYEICLSCFGREIIRQIEFAMTNPDKIGATDGNA